MLFVLYFIQFQLAIVGVYIVFTKRDFATAIGAGVFSLLSILIYVMLSATDLATTEAAISLSLGTTLYMLTMLFLRSYKKSGIKNELHKLNYNNGILITICMISLYVTFIKILPTISKNDGIEKHYVQNTKKDYKFNSMVTAIVAGYRGFDTLFETLVIFIAGTGVYAILVGDKKDKSKYYE